MRPTLSAALPPPVRVARVLPVRRTSGILLGGFLLVLIAVAWHRLELVSPDHVGLLGHQLVDLGHDGASRRGVQVPDGSVLGRQLVRQIRRELVHVLDVVHPDQVFLHDRVPAIVLDDVDPLGLGLPLEDGPPLIQRGHVVRHLAPYCLVPPPSNKYSLSAFS